MLGLLGLCVEQIDSLLAFALSLENEIPLSQVSSLHICVVVAIQTAKLFFTRNLINFAYQELAFLLLLERPVQVPEFKISGVTEELVATAEKC